MMDLKIRVFQISLKLHPIQIQIEISKALPAKEIKLQKEHLLNSIGRMNNSEIKDPLNLYEINKMIDPKANILKIQKKTNQ